MNQNLSSFLNFNCFDGKLVRKKTILLRIYIHYNRAGLISSWTLDSTVMQIIKKDFANREPMYIFIYQDLSPIFILSFRTLAGSLLVIQVLNI